MVEVLENITNAGAPRRTRSVKFICDGCGYECSPESANPAEWLYQFDDHQVCWVCLMSEAGFETVTE